MGTSMKKVVKVVITLAPDLVVSLPANNSEIFKL